MSKLPPNKRQRRVSVQKPFKSPFQNRPSSISTVSQSTDKELSSVLRTSHTTSDIAPPAPGSHALLKESQSSPRRRSIRGRCMITAENRHLVNEIRSSRSNIETLNQALTCNDAQTLDSIMRWRQVARQVAEELFILARDRVELCGGLQVWKSLNTESLNDMYHEHVTDIPDENQAIDDEVSDFTIGTMLQTMGVEVEFLGWDVDQETWNDD